MITGVALAVATILVISNRPGENIESRITRSFQNSPQLEEQPIEKPEPPAKQVVNEESLETNPAPLVSAPKIPKPRYHIVEKGETLSSIATDYYGNRNQVDRIVKANPHTITNVNNIRPGMRISIPY